MYVHYREKTVCAIGKSTTFVPNLPPEPEPHVSAMFVNHKSLRNSKAYLRKHIHMAKPTEKHFARIARLFVPPVNLTFVKTFSSPSQPVKSRFEYPIRLCTHAILPLNATHLPPSLFATLALPSLTSGSNK